MDLFVINICRQFLFLQFFLLLYVLQLLADAGIGVKYIYSTIQSAKGEAAITMKTTDQKRAENILTAAGVRLCEMEDLK